MRKLMTILAAFGCALTLAACGDQNEQKTDQPAATAERPAATPPQRAAVTTAPTPTQIVRCVSAGLTADHRTEAQARRLPVNAEVTINGAKQRLAAGQSYWSLCSGPSVHERLAAAEARIATLTRERDVARAATTEMSGRLDRVLDQWVYVDPEAGNGVENTWKHRAEQNGGIDWLKWVFALVAVIAIGGWVISARRRRSPEQIGMGGPREPRQPDDAGSPAFEN